MRAIDPSTRFRRDYKREKKGPYGRELDQLFADVVECLAADKPLDVKHRDHPLTGNWQSFRDCHIKPDLVLIYRKIGDNILQLARLGSHSELGL